MINGSRAISFIEENEDLLEEEVNRALKSSVEDNLRKYLQLVASLAAMSGIDIYNTPKDTRIYYIEDAG